MVDVKHDCNECGRIDSPQTASTLGMFVFGGRHVDSGTSPMTDDKERLDDERRRLRESTCDRLSWKKARVVTQGGRERKAELG